MYNNNLYIQLHFVSVKKKACFYMFYDTVSATEVSNAFFLASVYCHIINVRQNVACLKISSISIYFTNECFYKKFYKTLLCGCVIFK